MAWKTVENHASLRMTRYYMRMIGMWYAENNRDRLISNAVLGYTLLTMITAVVIMGTDCFYSWGDLHAISFNAPCTATVCIELTKLLILVVNRKQVLEFNAFTDKTFWKINYETVDLEILERCNAQTKRMNGILAILIQIIAWHYLSIPMFESIGKTSSERILPFKLWFNLPLTETPYYEIAFAIEAAACISVSICTTTCGSFLFTICIYATGQFKILQRRFKICCDCYDREITNECSYEKLENLAFDELRDCIIQHQMMISYMERLENLYCWIMLGEALGAVFQICFSGFQVVLGVEESMSRTALSLEFLGGATILLYLFSWACHEIIEESTAIAEAAYNASWYILPNYKWGQSYRAALLIVMARARRPCILTVGKFTPMSLETFTSVCSSSLSYFTILRQMNEENPVD